MCFCVFKLFSVVLKALTLFLLFAVGNNIYLCCNYEIIMNVGTINKNNKYLG